MTDTSLIPEKRSDEQARCFITSDNLELYQTARDFRSQSEPTPNHTFVKLLKGGFLTVALIRNAPDVPEQFISVKLIRFALSLYPVVFIVHGHYPAKFMTEHSLSNMRLDIHLGQTM